MRYHFAEKKPRNNLIHLGFLGIFLKVTQYLWFALWQRFWERFLIIQEMGFWFRLNDEVASYLLHKLWNSSFFWFKFDRIVKRTPGKTGYTKCSKIGFWCQHSTHTRYEKRDIFRHKLYLKLSIYWQNIFWK